jgi:hypothetical protein
MYGSHGCLSGVNVVLFESSLAAFRFRCTSEMWARTEVENLLLLFRFNDRVESDRWFFQIGIQYARARARV